MVKMFVSHFTIMEPSYLASSYQPRREKLEVLEKYADITTEIKALWFMMVKSIHPTLIRLTLPNIWDQRTTVDKSPATFVLPGIAKEGLALIDALKQVSS